MKLPPADGSFDPEFVVPTREIVRIVMDKHAFQRAARRKVGKVLRRSPAILYPRNLENEYARQLKIRVSIARKLVHLHIVPMIPELYTSVPDELIRHDASYSTRLSVTINSTKLAWGQVIKVDQEARDVATEVAKEHDRQQTRAVRAVIGVEPEITEPWLGTAIDSFAHDNARLVKGVGESFFSSLETKISSGVRQGARPEDLQTSIAADFVEEGEDADRADTRAELIAHDQIGSLFGDLSRVRQTELGIRKYIWRTVHDERVRDSHRERDGLTFDWGRPIEEQLDEQGLEVDDIEGPPGRPIRCRCTAEPDFSGLIDDLPPI